jgi:transposase
MTQNPTSGAGVAVRERQPRHLAANEPRSLDDLAATANREHDLCGETVRSALEHAIAAGEALLAARAQVDEREWPAWLTENFRGSRRAASRYVRVATYSDRIDPSTQTLRDAYLAIAGEPDALSRGHAVVVPPAKRTEALALVERGHSIRAAADEVGVSRNTVSKWVDQKRFAETAAKRKRRQRHARAALEAQERQRQIAAAVRKAGAALSEAYSMTAKMGKVLDQAEAEATTGEAREALVAARGHYHRMSDEIVRALGVQS